MAGGYGLFGAQTAPGKVVPEAVPEAVSVNEDELMRQVLEPVAETTTAAPVAEAAPEWEIHVVQPGEILSQISKKLGVPLKTLAEDNDIKDVGKIFPNQRLKYLKPGAVAVKPEAVAVKPEAVAVKPEAAVVEPEAAVVEPEAAAVEPEDAGVLPEEKGGHWEFNALGRSVWVEDKPDPSKIVSGKEKPVETTEDAAAETVAETVADKSTFEVPEQSKPINILSAITRFIGNTEDKKLLEDELKELDKIVIPTFDQKYYDVQAKSYTDEIKKYDDALIKISEEEYEPPFEGWNKVWAVIGAALGAYGSAMTGSPNFAMNIINAELDRDQKRFLARKEIRSKAVDSQRLDTIRRRGEMLQSIRDKFNAALQTTTAEINKTNAEATLMKIDETLVSNREQIKLLKIGIIKDILVSENQLAASLNKEDRKKWVNGIEIKDGKGDPFWMPGFVARSEDAAAEITKDHASAYRVEQILDELDDLHGKPESFGPVLFAATAQRIDSLSQELQATLKDYYGMGANYTKLEMVIITAQIPTSNWFEKFKAYKVKSDALRDQFVGKLIAKYKAYRGTSMRAQPESKKPKNLEEGYKEAGG